MPQNDGGGIRRNGGVYFHRHTGLVPVSSQIACRPWRLIIALDSGMRRNDDGEFAGMTTGNSPEWRRGIRRNGGGGIRRNGGGGIRRNGGVYFHRHTGLVPVSSQIACRPWRLIIALDSGMRRNDDGGIRRNDDGEFAGMTAGEFAGMTAEEFAGMAAFTFIVIPGLSRYPVK